MAEDAQKLPEDAEGLILALQSVGVLSLIIAEWAQVLSTVQDL